MQKEELTKRLARIEGQVHGLSRMVAEERYCIDILDQISAVNRALESPSASCAITWAAASKTLPQQAASRPPKRSKKPQKPSRGCYAAERIVMLRAAVTTS